MTERKPDSPEDRIETLRRMHAAGSSDERIALALGLKRRVVTDKRCRLGLQIRSEIDPYGASLRRAERLLRQRQRDGAP